MKKFFITSLIFAFGFTYSQESKELSVNTLKGIDKCAYTSFIKTIKSNLTLPDNTVFSSKADVVNKRHYYSIGSSFSYQKQINGKTEDREGYYCVKMKISPAKKRTVSSSRPTKTPSSDICENLDYRLLGLYNSRESISESHIQYFAEDYDSSDTKSSDYAFVKKNKKWGAIDKSGNILIHLKYDSLVVHRLGLLAKSDKKWEIIDEENGTVKTQKKYDQISTSFPRVKDIRLGAVSNNGKYGFINKEYQEIVPTIYDKVNILAFKFPIGIRNGKTVLLDEYTGKELTPLKYDDLRFLNDEKLVALDFTNKKIGIITDKGVEFLPAEYGDLKNHIAIQFFAAMKNGKYALFTWKDASRISDFVYDEEFEMLSREDNLITTQINKKLGVLDIQGKLIVPCKYKKITFKDNKITASTETQNSVFDVQGKCLENCN